MTKITPAMRIFTADDAQQRLLNESRAERTEILFSTAPTAIIASFVLGAVATFYLGYVAGAANFLPWSTVFFALALCRCGIYAGFFECRTCLADPTWTQLYALNSCLIALLWGLAVFLFADIVDANEKLLIIVTAISAISSSGSLYRSFMPISASYLLAGMLPVSFYLLAADSLAENFLGALSCYQIVWMLKINRDLHAHLLGSIQQRQANSEQAQKMTELAHLSEQANRSQTDFLANVSHEIRTPMAGLLGMLQFIKESPESPKNVEYVKIANDSAQALLSLINDLLDLSKIQEGKFTVSPHPCDLRATVYEPISLLQKVADEKAVALSVRFDFEDELWLMIDGARVRQVVLNLVGNALKFTDQGAVEVTVSHQMLGSQRCEFSVRVRDSGIGIEPQILESLFGRFVQADGTQARRYGGSGLGLSISQSLIDVMGGELEAQSAVGQGSEFVCRVAVPTALKPATEVAGVATPERTDNQRLHLLVVDDNPVNLLIMEKLVQSFGWSLETATSGAQALEIFSESAGLYDAVLMDIQMPTMDGIEATHRLRELTRTSQRVPIIAVTANSFDAEIEHLFAQGLDGYVSKPINGSKLKHEVLSLVRPVGEPLPSLPDTAHRPGPAI